MTEWRLCGRHSLMIFVWSVCSRRMSSLFCSQFVKSLTVYLQNGHKFWLSNLKANSSNKWLNEWKINTRCRLLFIECVKRTENTSCVLEYCSRIEIVYHTSDKIVGQNKFTHMYIYAIPIQFNANVASVLVLFYAYILKQSVLALDGFRHYINILLVNFTTLLIYSHIDLPSNCSISRTHTHTLHLELYF